MRALEGSAGSQKSPNNEYKEWVGRAVKAPRRRQQWARDTYSGGRPGGPWAVLW